VAGMGRELSQPCSGQADEFLSAGASGVVAYLRVRRLVARMTPMWTLADRLARQVLPQSTEFAFSGSDAVRVGPVEYDFTSPVPGSRVSGTEAPARRLM